ncbi:C-type lectin domain family 2 member B-like [Tachyglossus aculeatus]|uniref:C-type lectin domain family 2 member B-like n=1 Tax=Tachyglossus aculeatus TaxID=9261 RepID=UPI0018F44774|nr:C-type lectin domain family 2 member B-like [Tachyglossus aculeatus]
MVTEDDTNKENNQTPSSGPSSGIWPLSKKYIIILIVVIALIVLVLAIVLGVTLGRKGDPSVHPGPTQAPCQPNCSGDWELVEAKCFFLSSETRDWDTTKEICGEHQGTLAVVSKGQLEILKKRVGSSDYWIGLRKKVNQDWQWDDNTPFKNEFEIKGAGDCAYLDSSNVNSAGCSQPRRWICSRNPSCP